MDLGGKLGRSEEACIETAATALADKLKELADRLGGEISPRRVRFGRARFGFLRPRSPRGFVISHHDLEVLLPDGRVWTADLPNADRRAGRYVDIVEHAHHHATSRMTVHGKDFVFLGLTIGGYSFGVTDVDDECRLCAMVTTAQEISMIDADDALNAVAHKAAGV